MAPPAKRRRTAPASSLKDTSHTASIQHYTKITKSHIHSTRATGKESSKFSTSGKDASAPQQLGSKRKHASDGEDITQLPTPESTPQKQRKWLKNIPLQEPGSSLATPPTTPTKPKQILCTAVPSLPEEIEGLVDMNTSFLKALSVHFAHEGAAANMDIRLITASLSKIWRKRRTTLQDIQLCLGLLGNDSPFTLMDYGRNKVCIQLKDHRRTNDFAAPVQELELGHLFATRLRKKWEMEGHDQEAEIFIQSLPNAQIVECPSLKKVAPALAKGQRRLDDLIGIAKDAQKATSLSDLRSVSQQERSNAKGRNTSLLERMRAKEQLLASQAAPLSKTQLVRKAALQRVEGITSVLSAPRSGGLKHTYSLHELVEVVQDSAKTEWSSADIESSITVLAEDANLAPGFVRTVKLGSVVAVVVDLSKRPGREDLSTRIGTCLDQLGKAE